MLSLIGSVMQTDRKRGPSYDTKKKKSMFAVRTSTSTRLGVYKLSIPFRFKMLVIRFGREQESCETPTLRGHNRGRSTVE